MTFMATPSEKLAESLQALHAIQELEGVLILKTSEISRTHRERLTKNGFLKQVTKGWYIAVNPNENPGESTSWYASYWQFCSRFLSEQYGQDYCLSAEQSLMVHTGKETVPQELIIRSPNASNQKTRLLFDTSFYAMKSHLPDKANVELHKGIWILSLSSSLINCSPLMFRKNSDEVKIALAQIQDSSEILPELLENSHTVIAGRLAGAFRSIGKDRIANDIVKTMKGADFQVREKDPFELNEASFTSLISQSPYENRIRLMWNNMRDMVIKHFPEAPKMKLSSNEYLASIDEIYVTDAYHSLSLEKYKVTEELIKKVASGSWDTTLSDKDREQKDAMAARGYWLAMNAVKVSISKILSGSNPGLIVNRDHGDWYMELFFPAVRAGLIKVSDLAGYRIQQVYISQSKHIPMNKGGIREALPVFFELLGSEPHPGVRAVLGHFVFVYIHPYMDGNGRMARFLMNVMLASGGYPWTVIPVQKRDIYMEGLEKASLAGDIEPFAEFIAQLVRDNIRGMTLGS